MGFDLTCVLLVSFCVFVLGLVWVYCFVDCFRRLADLQFCFLCCLLFTFGFDLVVVSC